jgi:hypothetical protein
LKAQRTELEAQLRNLTKERDALSLASLSGDANATTAIEAIDRERQRLAGQVESINAGLRTLASRPKPQKQLTELLHLDRLKAALRSIVVERRENLAFSLSRPGTRRDADAFDYAEPVTVARELLQFAFPQVVTDDEGKRSQLVAERDADITRLAVALVEATELPPLPDAIARYVGSKGPPTIRELNPKR